MVIVGFGVGLVGLRCLCRMGIDCMTCVGLLNLGFDWWIRFVLGLFCGLFTEVGFRLVVLLLKMCLIFWG